MDQTVPPGTAPSPVKENRLRAFERADVGVRVVALSVDDEETAAALVGKHKLTFPVLLRPGVPVRVGDEQMGAHGDPPARGRVSRLADEWRAALTRLVNRVPQEPLPAARRDELSELRMCVLEVIDYPSKGADHLADGMHVRIHPSRREPIQARTIS